jgi:hypothetical protein
LDKGGEWDEEEEGAFAEQKTTTSEKNDEHWKNNSYSIS